MWLALILGLALIMVVFSIVSSIRGKKTAKENPDASQRSCKSCMEVIPLDFEKALCPHCKKFLA